MAGAWLAINNLFLFPFPIAPKLRPDNYYSQFVPQVTAAIACWFGLEVTR